MNGSQSQTNVVRTPTYGVKEHDPPACGVRLFRSETCFFQGGLQASNNNNNNNNKQQASKIFQIEKSQAPSYVVYTPTCGVEYDGKNTNCVPALCFQGVKSILFGLSKGFQWLSMVFNGFIGKKCKVENFPDMNGSQSQINVVCTPTCGVKEHEPPACGVRLLHFNGFQWIYRQKMQS